MIRTPQLRAALLAVLAATSVVAGVAAFGGTAFGQDAGETGEVLVVDERGDEENYTSIGAALDDATADDTVVVHDGTYDEQVVLDTADVTLEAVNASGATIRYDPGSATGQPTVAVTANGSTVSGFVVKRVAADDRGTGTGPSFAQGLRVSASDATVADNEVVGADFQDVNNKGVMVLDDESGGSGETVENVTVENNDVSGFAGPLSFAAYYGGSVSAVDLSGNSLDGYLSAGVAVGEQNDGTVAVDLAGYGYEATSEQYPGTTTYFESRSDALDFGANASGVVVEGPGGDYAVGPGMSIQDAVNATEAGDTVEVGPGTYDERVEVGTSNVSVVGSGGPGAGDGEQSVVNSTDGPVVQVNAANVTVGGFVVTGAEGDNEDGQGVDVNGDEFDTGGVRLADLVVKGNHDRGLVVDYTDDATVENVVVKDNFDPASDGDDPEDPWESSDDADGVILWYTNSSQVVDVRAIHNGDNGVYSKGDDNYFENVTATDNGDEGLDVSSDGVTGGAEIVDLTSHSNDAEALEIEGNDAGANVTVEGVTLSDSPRGLFVRGNNAGPVAVRNATFGNNAVQVRDNSSSVDVQSVFETATFDRAAVVRDTGDAIYGTIQDAVDAAGPGDTVEVGPGTYTSALDVDEEGLTVVSTAGPARTTIDFAGGEPAVEILASGATFEDFEITNVAGEWESGQGLSVSNNAGATLENVTVRDLHVHGVGDKGLVVDFSENTLVEDVRVHHNPGDEGITVWKANGTTLRNVTAYANGHDPNGNDEFNPGIFVNGNRTTLVNVTAYNNSDYGVAVDNKDAWEYQSTPGIGLAIANSTFHDNPAGGVGVFENERQVTVGNSQFLGSVGVVTENSTGVDATQNYWDAADGPADAGPGSGTAVAGNVTFGPWFADAGLTELSSDPPRITNVTLTDAADGDGTVGGGDEVRVGAAVADANGVRNVTVDASAFGAGTVTLTDPGGDGRYAATLVVDAAAATEGEHALTVAAVDGRDNAASAGTAGHLQLTVGAPGGTPGGPPPNVGAGTDDGGQADDADAPVDAVSATIEGGNATVALGDDGNVSTMRVAFDAGASGEVTVERVEGMPANVTPVPDATPVALVDVTVPDGLTDDAATLRFTVSADAVGDADPSDLVVYHHTGGDWEALDTSVVSTADGEVVLEADTPGFSLFVVGASETQETTTPPPTTDEPDDTTDEPDATTSEPGTTDEPGDTTTVPGTTAGPGTTTPVEEPGGFGSLATAGIVVLVGVVLALFYVRYRRD